MFRQMEIVSIRDVEKHNKFKEGQFVCRECDHTFDIMYDVNVNLKLCASCAVDAGMEISKLE